MHGMGGYGNLPSGALAGLQSSTEAIIHAAGVDPVPVAGFANLTRGAAANMKRWSPDIRALILQSTFLHQLGWATDDAVSFVSITWGGTPVCTVKPPENATLALQCDLVRCYADQRADRANEILSQLGAFSPYFAIILGLTEGRNPRTFELLDAVQTIAGLVTMMPKHLFACRRPAEFDTRILPLIATPSHGSFPSSHATQAFAMASVLAALVGAHPDHFGDVGKRIDLTYRQAHRIAVNRTVAGVHFPIDSWAGARLGVQIGRILGAMMGSGGTVHGTDTYDPNTAPGTDFLFADLAAVLVPAGGPAVPVAQDPLMNWLWSQARDEFALHSSTLA